VDIRILLVEPPNFLFKIYSVALKTNKHVHVQSNMYIKTTQAKGTWKCDLYEQLPFIYRLQLYALFINGKMRLPFIDSDLLWRCPLMQVWLYIVVSEPRMVHYIVKFAIIVAFYGTSEIQEYCKSQDLMGKKLKWFSQKVHTVLMHLTDLKWLWMIIGWVSTKFTFLMWIGIKRWPPQNNSCPVDF
jgi:hypothetical protein